MTSETENVFSLFYLHVEDYKIPGLEQEIVDEMLNSYLRAVIAKPFVRKLFSFIEFDEDVGEITYTMRDPWDDASDVDFVEEMLSMGMVWQWLRPRYYSDRNTAQFFTNKDLSFFSQANHMAELKAMYETAYIDLRKFIRDRGFAVRVANSE